MTSRDQPMTGAYNTPSTSDRIAVSAKSPHPALGLSAPCSRPLAKRLVWEYMVTTPKSATSTITVAEALQAFSDDHVHMLLIVEKSRLVATLIRGDIPTSALDHAPAIAYGTLESRLIGPNEPAEHAWREMRDLGIRRLAVVDEAGILLGLLCLKASGKGFCSDDNVAARAAARANGARSDTLGDPTDATEGINPPEATSPG